MDESILEYVLERYNNVLHTLSAYEAKLGTELVHTDDNVWEYIVSTVKTDDIISIYKDAIKFFRHRKRHKNKPMTDLQQAYAIGILTDIMMTIGPICEKLNLYSDVMNLMHERITAIKECQQIDL